MNANRDLFSLSFDTKAEAGEQGGPNFLRPDAYTIEQLQAEIVDLVAHPDNAHVVALEIRRIGHVDSAIAPKLTPLDLRGNAYAGFSLESTSTDRDVPFCQITGCPRVAAEKLAELLTDPATSTIKLYW